MSKQIALSGSLVDVRNYAQSKSVRLIVEIPAEQAGEVIAQFGWPTPAAVVPVAIARLAVSAKEVMPRDPSPQASDNTGPRPTDQVGGDKTKRAWGELTPAQQAAIRGGDSQFQRFLANKFPGYSVTNADEAAYVIRSTCGVLSRKDIVSGSEAARIWYNLNGDFEAYLRYGEMA